MRGAGVWSVVGLAALAAGVVTARSWPRSRAPERERAAVAQQTVLRVPRAHGPIVLDGELGDAAWLADSARTGDFLAPSGEPGRPHAEARFSWGDDRLYVALYAADSDIRAARVAPDGPLWLGDTFELTFDSPDGQRRIDVAPDGTVTDARRTDGAWDYAWQSGVQVARDADGTINEPSDEDEEWVLELAIPLRALGLDAREGARADLHVVRCDVVPRGPRRCTSWGEGEGRSQLELGGPAVGGT